MKARLTVVSLATALVALWPAPASAHISNLFNGTIDESADPLRVTVGIVCTAGERVLVRSGVSEEAEQPNPNGVGTQGIVTEYGGAGYAKAVCTGSKQLVTVTMTKEEGTFTAQVCPPHTVTWESTAVTKVGGEIHDKARTSTVFTVENC